MNLFALDKLQNTITRFNCRPLKINQKLVTHDPQEAIKLANC